MAKTFSVEDGNLSSSLIKSSRAKVYKDIDLTFTVKPSGEIYKKQDAAAVKQAIKNLLLTNFGEKPFNANFGANLRAWLFELADEDTEISDYVKQLEADKDESELEEATGEDIAKEFERFLRRQGDTQ